MRKRIHCTISGRVQLVMYRDFARRKAKRLGIVGWVKNRKDNTVELMAEGEEKDLKKYARMLHEGPILAEVEAVECRWWEGATGEFKTFEIIYEQ